MSVILGQKALLSKLNSMEKGLFDCVYVQVGKEVDAVRSRASMLCPTNHGELRQSIVGTTSKKEDSIQGVVSTNKEYASYVEFGTGPKGQANHAGISPNVSVSYSQQGWLIPASAIPMQDAFKYKMYPNNRITINGNDFYKTLGQSAQPFMYPALKDYEKTASKNIGKAINKYLKGLGKK